MDPTTEFLKVLAEFLAMTLGVSLLISGAIVAGVYCVLYLIDSRKEK
jgi:hypothetical protein